MSEEVHAMLLPASHFQLTVNTIHQNLALRMKNNTTRADFSLASFVLFMEGAVLPRIFAVEQLSSSSPVALLVGQNNCVN